MCELGKNTLDLYLNDVYEKECIFKTRQDEVDFIQTGIETLIQTLVDLALVHFKDPDSITGLFETLKVFSDETCPSDIIKVGSFYEGTKNNFPDEFDFIFLLYCSGNIVKFGENNLSIKDYDHKIQKPLTNAILGLSGITKKYKASFLYTNPDETRKVYFEKYMYAKGPSAKLRFIYENESRVKKDINVDLVPAIRNLGDTLEPCVNIICHLPEFQEEIYRTGSFLYINSFFANYTFTETEVYFMKNVLSKNHVKVYRILKFLINGHGDDEELKNYLHEVHSGFKTCKLYSSYRIKTMMIYHHYQCTNVEQTNIGHCVLKILNEMSKYSDIDSFPNLVYKIDAFKSNRVDVHSSQTTQYFFTMQSGMESNMPLLPHLQSLIDHLTLLQNSVDSYDYERDKFGKSVARLYLENQSMDKLL